MEAWLRCFRISLLILPPQFRWRHEAEMLQDVEHGLRARTGGWARLRFVGSAMYDAARYAWRVRHDDSRPRSSRVAGLAHDVRSSARSLCRTPGFSIVAVTTLALGIGSNAIIFSVLHGVVLKPLPYEASERIGILWHDLGDGAQSLPAVNASDVYDYGAWSRTFEAFTLATGRERVLGGERPRLVHVGMVAAGFFEFFGIAPALGRGILPEEDVPAGPPVALLSHRLWRSEFGADPGVLGRAIDLEGIVHTVIGVLPPFELFLPREAFRLRDADVWSALRIDRTDLPPRNVTGFTAFARLRGGVDWAAGQADLDRMAADLRSRYPEHEESSLRARVVPLRHDVAKQARVGLGVLFGAVALVLLIACANVTILLLTRALRRGREFAVRKALGAGTGDLTRLVVVESALIALFGGLLGVAFAPVGLDFVAATASSDIPRLDDVRIDGVVLGFLLAVVSLAALASGVLPAVRSARTRPAMLLGRAVGGGAGGRVRRALVGVEVALSVVLLAGAAILIRSFIELQELRPGFDPRGRIALRVSLPGSQFASHADRQAFWADARERLAAIPGVEAVAATTQLPLTGSGSLSPFAYDARTASNWESVTADERGISPGYLDAIGTRLVAGRDFGPPDLVASEHAPILIDETLAAMAFPAGGAVGRLLQTDRDGVPGDFSRIVGVVEHVHLHDLARPGLPQIYHPFSGGGRFTIVLRAVPSTPLGPLVGRIEGAIRRLDRSIVIDRVRPVEETVFAAMTGARLNLGAMIWFAAIALILSMGGLYGVISYLVDERRREMGIRLALGRTPRGLRSDVMREAAVVVAVAAAAGLVAAVGLSRLMSGLLVGVSALDWPSYAAAAGVLASTALVASWVPASRVTRIDPLQALRED